MAPTPVLLPGKSHGRRSLVGSSPWGLKESDTTEWLHFHFSLSCIGEGNGNPLQCSCLENPRDGGAWWATIYGVAQSQTQLKQLSSSSSSIKGGKSSQSPSSTFIDWKMRRDFWYMFIGQEINISSVQFSHSVVSDSLWPMNHSTPGLPVHHQLLEFVLKLTSIESVMPSSHLIFCRPLLLLPPIPPSIKVFSSESTLRMRWPKYWEFQL